LPRNRHCRNDRVSAADVGRLIADDDELELLADDDEAGATDPLKTRSARLNGCVAVEVGLVVV
jgi:hypothetical protein